MIKNLPKIIVLIIFGFGILWWSKTYDIGSYEALEIQESDVPFLDFLDPTKPIQSYSDRGPIFPALLKIHKSIVGADIFKLRWLSLFFLFLSGVFILYFPHRSFTEQQRWFVFLMLMTNIYFIKTNCFLKPYSFIFLISLGVFYSYLRVIDNLKSRKELFLFVTLSCLAITTFFTSALICWLCFLSILINKRKLSVRFYLSFVALTAFTVPKFLMIYNFRFIIRRGQTNFERIGHLGAFESIKDLFGLLSSVEILNIGFLFLLMILFVYGISKEKTKIVFSGVAVSYLALTLASIVILKYLGLREIEARYYFQLLPLFYAIVGVSKSRVLLFFLILLGGLCSYSYAKDYRPVPYTETAKYLISNMSPGDIVCTPQLNGYTEKIYQAADFYLQVKRIAGESTEEYFQCRKFFNEKKSLDYDRIWIVAFRDEWIAGEKCQPWADVFDCEEGYYPSQLGKYDFLDRRVLVKDHHSKSFIYLYKRKQFHR